MDKLSEQPPWRAATLSDSRHADIDPSVVHQAVTSINKVRFYKSPRMQELHPRSIYAVCGKRLFDLLVCLLTLPSALILVVVLAVVVALDGGKPFYRHERVGRDGKMFGCLKVRTMAVNADDLLARLLASDAAAAAEWSQFQKLENDPRVTRLGRFLRKSNLDELPQIWNVLVGDMSWVGPRPVTREELERYGRDRRAYLSVRPGITGRWQIIPNRNSISYSDRVKLDVEYVRTVGLLNDLWIMTHTVKHVLHHSGK